MPKRSQSKSHVEFKSLNFQAAKSAGLAYEQVHVGMEINANDENTKIDVLQPLKTLAFDQETKEVTTDNVTMSGSVGGSVGFLNPMPTMSLTGSSSKGASSSTEFKKYHSRITAEHFRWNCFMGILC